MAGCHSLLSVFFDLLAGPSATRVRLYQSHNPKPYRSLIGALFGTLIDPFKGTPHFRKLPYMSKIPPAESWDEGSFLFRV